MVLINYADRTINCKIAYYGQEESGKTTNLKYIYNQLDPSIKGKLISLEEGNHRTVFFDYMMLDLGKVKDFDTKFSLYSTAGQESYGVSRNMILNGVDGIIFVVDSRAEKLQNNIDHLKDLEENLKANNLSFSKIPLIFQYNKRDLEDITPLEELEEKLNKYNYPSFETVATEGTGVFACLKSITSLVLTSLQ